MCSISHLNSVAFLQGNARKSIHDIESTIESRLLKKSLLCVLELRIEIMVPKLASKAAVFTLPNRTSEQFMGTSMLLFLCLMSSGPCSLQLQCGVLHLVLLPLL